MRLSHLILGIGIVLFIVGLLSNSLALIVVGTALTLMGIIRA